MLCVQSAPTFLKPDSPRATGSPRHTSGPVRPSVGRLACRAQGDLAQKALASPDDRMRRWGLTELVRLQPADGARDALRCSVLARFVRTSRTCDHHALLDAFDAHGVSPRMLPVFQELLQSKSPGVRLRAAPLWGALIGVYRLSAGEHDGVRIEAEWAERELRELSTE